MADVVQVLLMLLSSLRAHTRDEKTLQGAIEAELREAGLSFTREARLSASDRPDFMVGTVAVEVKTDGSAPHVERQLRRYAEHDAVGALVLVTTRSKHGSVARELEGKPVHVLNVGGFL